MQDFPLSATGTRADQAHGLRRLFAGTRAHHIALVANPHVAFTGVVLERLSTVLGAMGLSTLVVDAADTSPAPNELAALDLRGCIEQLSSQVAYLAARGLPLSHVNTRGSSAHLLDRLQAAAPQCRVLLVHAGAADLARLFAQHRLRPVLLAADRPASLTHAYAAMKLLALRCDFMSHDLLIAAPPSGSRVPRIAQRLASCGERFLGTALHDWVAIDPACDVREPPAEALSRLVAAQLQLADDGMPLLADMHAAPPGWRESGRHLAAPHLN